jgi:hypothetical protein
MVQERMMPEMTFQVARYVAYTDGKVGTSYLPQTPEKDFEWARKQSPLVQI